MAHPRAWPPSPPHQRPTCAVSSTASTLGGASAFGAVRSQPLSTASPSVPWSQYCCTIHVCCCCFGCCACSWAPGSAGSGHGSSGLPWSSQLLPPALARPAADPTLLLPPLLEPRSCSKPARGRSDSVQTQFTPAAGAAAGAGWEQHTQAQHATCAAHLDKMGREIEGGHDARVLQLGAAGRAGRRVDSQALAGAGAGHAHVSAVRGAASQVCRIMRYAPLGRQPVSAADYQRTSAALPARACWAAPRIPCSPSSPPPACQIRWILLQGSEECEGTLREGPSRGTQQGNRPQGTRTRQPSSRVRRRKRGAPCRGLQQAKQREAMGGGGAHLDCNHLRAQHPAVHAPERAAAAAGRGEVDGARCMLCAGRGSGARQGCSTAAHLPSSGPIWMARSLSGTCSPKAPRLHVVLALLGLLQLALSCTTCRHARQHVSKQWHDQRAAGKSNTGLLLQWPARRPSPAPHANVHMPTRSAAPAPERHAPACHPQGWAVRLLRPRREGRWPGGPRQSIGNPGPAALRGLRQQGGALGSKRAVWRCGAAARWRGHCDHCKEGHLCCHAEQDCWQLPAGTYPGPRRSLGCRCAAQRETGGPVSRGAARAPVAAPRGLRGGIGSGEARGEAVEGKARSGSRGRPWCSLQAQDQRRKINQDFVGRSRRRSTSNPPRACPPSTVIEMGF